MQVPEPVELAQNPGKRVEVHERRRPVWRPVPPELDRAHLTSQIALPDRLDLQISWQPRCRYAEVDRHGRPAFSFSSTLSRASTAVDKSRRWRTTHGSPASDSTSARRLDASPRNALLATCNVFSR